MTSIAVSASYVASGDIKGVVTVFDRAARTKKCYFPVHDRNVLDVQFTPDEKWITSFGNNKAFCMGDPENAGTKRKVERKYLSLF